MGLIEIAEFNRGIRFVISPPTSGLNRKLSAFVKFQVKRSKVNLKVDLEVCGAAEFNGTSRFPICPHTFGLNRKLSA